MTQVRGTINNYRGDAKTVDNQWPCWGRKLKNRVWNKVYDQQLSVRSTTIEETQRPWTINGRVGVESWKRECGTKRVLSSCSKYNKSKSWIFYSAQLVCNHDGDQFLKVIDLLKLRRFSTLVKIAKNETWKQNKYRFWGMRINF